MAISASKGNDTMLALSGRILLYLFFSTINLHSKAASYAQE
ncbi:MAG: hypothetical protein OFPI_11740 [Osedax symbiont Rs2]|nr:MAG: hypothetical protein OFPI_11740 [Osedax symbiont Rs2]